MEIRDVSISAPPQPATDEQRSATSDVRQQLPETSESDRRLHVFVAASLVVVTALLYLPVIGFEFVNWDDPWYVLENDRITSWSPANLYRIVSEPDVKNYAPLTTLSFLIDHTLWGTHPGGYHATNLLLHVANAVLVYFLLWQLTGSRFASWLTAMLFAVHPVQLESVAWVSSRKGLLSAAFILASLRFWLKPDRTARDEGFGLLFLFLALLAKAIAVVVPAVVLTYDLWIARKRFSEAMSRQFLPGMACFIFLMLTVSSQTTMYGGVRGHMALSKLQLVAVDSIILWRYVGMLLWPTDLCVLYDPATENIALPATLAILAWFAVVAAAYRVREQRPKIRWALCTAFLFLVPVLNFIPITTLMNDRYLYLPAIPLFGLFAVGLETFANTVGRSITLESTRGRQLLSRTLGTVAAGVCVAGATWTTWRHLPVWRNSRSLWRHAAAHVAHLPLVQYQLADAEYAAGNTDRAVFLLENALSQTTDAGDRKRFEQTLAQWRNRY